MLQEMSEEVTQREAHRSLILVLAGFSFSGLLAVAMVDAATQQNLEFSTYYLLVSFLFYLSALNLQDYKSHWWHDQLGDVLFESATLSLLLSVTAIIWFSSHGYLYKIIMTALASAIWLSDHGLRVYFLWSYFQAKEVTYAKGRKKSNSNGT